MANIKHGWIAPRYETRWAVAGTPFTFAREGQARAFALPGQAVVPVLRPSPYSNTEALEFLLGNTDASA